MWSGSTSQNVVQQKKANRVYLFFSIEICGVFIDMAGYVACPSSAALEVRVPSEINDLRLNR